MIFPFQTPQLLFKERFLPCLISSLIAPMKGFFQMSIISLKLRNNTYFILVLA